MISQEEFEEVKEIDRALEVLRSYVSDSSYMRRVIGINNFYPCRDSYGTAERQDVKNFHRYAKDIFKSLQSTFELQVRVQIESLEKRRNSLIGGE